jgi:hypothetical protein
MCINKGMEKVTTERKTNNHYNALSLSLSLSLILLSEWHSFGGLIPWQEVGKTVAMAGKIAGEEVGQNMGGGQNQQSDNQGTSAADYDNVFSCMHTSLHLISSCILSLCIIHLHAF